MQLFKRMGCVLAPVLLYRFRPLILLQAACDPGGRPWEAGGACDGQGRAQVHGDGEARGAPVNRVVGRAAGGGGWASVGEQDVERASGGRCRRMVPPSPPTMNKLYHIPVILSSAPLTAAPRRSEKVSSNQITPMTLVYWCRIWDEHTNHSTTTSVTSQDSHQKCYITRLLLTLDIHQPLCLPKRLLHSLLPSTTCPSPPPRFPDSATPRSSPSTLSASSTSRTRLPTSRGSPRASRRRASSPRGEVTALVCPRAQFSYFRDG